MDYSVGMAILSPQSSGTEPPSPPLPVGAVDCHMHIFDPRFPFVPGRSPDYGTVADYRLFQKRMGLRRNIVVSPSSYGFDNSCLVDALRQFGAEARGIAGVAADVADAELDDLDAEGVRGVRLNFGRVAGTTIEDLERLAARVARLGWHLQLHMAANGIVEHEARLAGLPVLLVIDHYGCAPQPGGENHPVADVLCRLMDGGNTYVKLARHHNVPDDGHYEAHAPLARRLIRHAPDRLLWGSDWNHGQQRIKPDDAALVNQIARWSPDEAARHRILVDNPNRVYWGA